MLSQFPKLPVGSAFNRRRVLPVLGCWEFVTTGDPTDNQTVAHVSVGPSSRRNVRRTTLGDTGDQHDLETAK